MISIIIPLLNRYQLFSQCIRSLERTRRGYEIIVVDYGSTDGDVELRLKIAGVPAKTVNMQGPFVRAAALNAGADVAQGDILFFLDADMTVPIGFIEMIQKKVSPRHSWFPRCFVQRQDQVITPNDPLSTDGYGNCGVSRGDFKLAGGWDEGYRVWGEEDKAFNRTLRAKGVFVERELLTGFLHCYHPSTMKAGSPPPMTVVQPVHDPLANAMAEIARLKAELAGKIVAPPAPAPKPVPVPAPPPKVVAVHPPKPPPAPKNAPKPIDMGRPKKSYTEPDRDVLLATYAPEHALYLARLRPWFEKQGFAVYEKNGPRDYHWLCREKAKIIIVWNGAWPPQEGFLKYVRTYCCEHLLIAECGWFPGASKEFGEAQTLSLDRKGINFASEIVGFKVPLLDSEMEKRVKAYCKKHGRPSAGGRKTHIFIPLQLENDTNIVSNSPHFTKMQALIDFVEENTGMPVLVKRHPRDEKGEYTVTHEKSKVVTEGNLYDLIARCKAVIGINSTVILESLLLGKRVAALGKGLFTGHDVLLDCSDDPESVFKITHANKTRGLVEKKLAFLHELIFRRQIEFDSIDESMERNRVVQEVMAQCQ